ncbi:hypothetical protein J1N35_034528, partial [Gossypium stocksii]
YVRLLQSTATSTRNSKGTKSKWVSKEDVVLISCMVDLHNVGFFNADTRFKQLTFIYAKDQVTRKDAQIATDIFEELRAKDVANEEGSNENRCEFDASLDEMNVSATQPQLSNPNKVDDIFSKKKKKSSEASEPNSSTSLIDVMLLGDNIRTVGFELSRSIASKMFIKEKSSTIIQEKVQTLHVVLGEIKGLIDNE